MTGKISYTQTASTEEPRAKEPITTQKPTDISPIEEQSTQYPTSETSTKVPSTELQTTETPNTKAPDTLPLLRGTITLEAALEEEDNVLLDLSYPEKRIDFFVWFYSRSKEIEDLVSFHLGLSPPEKCRVSAVNEWLHGSFNVCIPVYIDNRTKSPGKRVLVRFPLPYKIGEPAYPGNADEKLRCEAATYIWMQENCPDIPIPQLWGFGFADGQTFTKPENVHWTTRLIWYLQRQVSRIFRYPPTCHYIIRDRKNILGNGYLLMEYIDDPGVEMLSRSWDEQRHDDDKRRTLFKELSRIMLSLSRIPLHCIGSWTLDSKGSIHLTNRPLTLRLHQFENEGIPTNIDRGTTYTTADSYYRDVLAYHDNRIRYQPNSIIDEKDGRAQMANLAIMRIALSALTRRDLCRGPFFFQLTDLHQSNMFVDKDWHIKYLIDLEWACSLPVEYLCPPWWLTGRFADEITGEHLDSFHKAYQEFTDIFGEEEKGFGPNNDVELYRTSIMRRGLRTGTFWYLQALDSPKGLFNIFRDHIQQSFTSSHRTTLEFPNIVSKYWAVDADEVIETKLKDKAVYEDKIRRLFQ
ncbi:hypothetical protein FQN49_003716 [Arthroderma sp. PD_2]|nr:hypothetical protein FQN49_003716 [Arthroderma sp. PD_2]